MAILAVLGVPLTIWTIWLLWHTLKQQREANRIASENGQLEARAYVMSLEVAHSPFPPTGPTVAVAFNSQWRNVGQTPARNLYHMFVCHPTGPEGIESDFKYPDFAELSRVGVLGPEEPLVSARLPYPLLLLQEVAEGRRRFFAYGWVEYSDVLKGTPRHRTEFCREMVISHQDGGGTQFHWIAYGPHNGMDTDTFNKPKT